MTDVLKGDVHVFADLIACTDQFEEPRVQKIWIGIQKPDPFDFRYLNHRFEQAEKRRAVFPIPAIGGQILGNEVDLFNPLPC
jgi:hypothetical protein